MKNSFSVASFIALYVKIFMTNALFIMKKRINALNMKFHLKHFLVKNFCKKHVIELYIRNIDQKKKK